MRAASLHYITLLPTVEHASRWSGSVSAIGVPVSSELSPLPQDLLQLSPVGGGADRAGDQSIPMRVLLRHADAGIRAPAAEPDAWRALTPLGWSQAHGVVDRLRGLAVMRVFTSPALRCRQTVVPLARSLLVDVEPRAELSLDARPERLLDFLLAEVTESAVLCTHREALEKLFVRLGPAHPVEGAVLMAKTGLWTVRPSPVPGATVVRHLSG